MPWTEEPGGLQFMGLQRVGYDWMNNTFICELTRSNLDKALPNLFSLKPVVPVTELTFFFFFPFFLFSPGISVKNCQRRLRNSRFYHTEKWGEVKITQLCPALCDPMDCIVHGILQARILEWVAFSFSRGSLQPRDRTQVSYIPGRFFTSWATREAREYWSG